MKKCKNKEKEKWAGIRPSPRRSKMAKMATHSSLQRSSALQRRRHCSQRQKFSDFVPKASYSYTNYLGTLIND